RGADTPGKEEVFPTKNPPHPSPRHPHHRPQRRPPAPSTSRPAENQTTVVIPKPKTQKNIARGGPGPSPTFLLPLSLPPLPGISQQRHCLSEPGKIRTVCLPHRLRGLGLSLLFLLPLSLSPLCLRHGSMILIA